MRQRLHFPRWAGTFAALCMAGLVIGPVGVRSQSSPDGARPDVPKSEQQPNLRRPSGSGGGSSTGGRRRLLSEDTFAEPTEIAAKPVKIEPPHPLAAAYPHHTVIVCVAGCSTLAAPNIVFIAPRSSTSSGFAVAQGQVHLASTTEPQPVVAVPSSGVVECIAGCVGPRPSVLRSSRPRQAGATVDATVPVAPKLVKAKRAAKKLVQVQRAIQKAAKPKPLKRIAMR